MSLAVIPHRHRYWHEYCHNNWSISTQPVRPLSHDTEPPNGSRVGTQDRKLRPQGFSILELLLASVVAAILLGAALPSFLTTLLNSRLDGAVRQVVGDIRTAQSYAGARGDLYRLHSGDDPLAGQPGRYRLEQSPDGGTTWNGVTAWYLLASDFPGVGIANMLDSGGPPTRVYELRFSPRGLVANPGTLAYPLNIMVAGQAGTRTVQIRQTGNVRVQ